MLKRLWTYVGGRSDIVLGDAVYMRRWRFLPDSWPGFRVHNILRSDQDRDLHDHPFDFISFVLKGGYHEFTPCPIGDTLCVHKKWYGPGSVIFRRAEDLHRLELPDGQPAWTFVIRGRYRREWGFSSNGVWVFWKDFVSGVKNEKK